MSARVWSSYPTLAAEIQDATCLPDPPTTHLGHYNRAVYASIVGNETQGVGQGLFDDVSTQLLLVVLQGLLELLDLCVCVCVCVCVCELVQWCHTFGRRACDSFMMVSSRTHFRSGDHIRTSTSHNAHLVAQLEQGAAATNDDTLLHGSLGGVQGILHAQLLLLQLSLSLGTDLCVAGGGEEDNLKNGRKHKRIKGTGPKVCCKASLPQLSDCAMPDLSGESMWVGPIPAGLTSSRNKDQCA